MSSYFPKPAFSPLSFLCTAFGHRYKVTHKVTNHINEYRCTQCGCEVTDSFSGRLEKLNYKNKEVNACLSSFFQKKNRKQLHQVNG